MRRLLPLIVVAGWLAMWTVSCESSDCMLSSESYCSMTFVDGEDKGVKLSDTLTVTTNMAGYDTLFVYRSDTDMVVSDKPVDSLLAKDYILTVETIRKQGVLINQKYGAEGMQLPLAYLVEADTFYLHYGSVLVDTLWVKHQNLPFFSSMECGTVMHYKLLNVSSTHHLIDSVRIVSADVTNTLRENVKIYYTVSN